jgi:hypothetical protein
VCWIPLLMQYLAILESLGPFGKESWGRFIYLLWGCWITFSWTLIPFSTKFRCRWRVMVSLIR